MADNKRKFVFEDYEEVEVEDTGIRIKVLKDVPFGDSPVLDEARRSLSESGGTTLTRGMVVAMADMAMALVCGWNIERKDGTPVPVTKENFLRLGSNEARAIVATAGAVFMKGRSPDLTQASLNSG